MFRYNGVEVEDTFADTNHHSVMTHSVSETIPLFFACMLVILMLILEDLTLKPQLISPPV